MPIFKVEAPDGSIIKVEAPEGATQQQILDFAKSQYVQKPSTQQTQQQAHQYIQQMQIQLSQVLMENNHLKEKNEYLENKIKSIITQQISDYKNK